VDGVLLLIVAVGTAFIAYWTLQMTQWAFMTDEMLYVKLATGYADTFSPVPQIRGEYFGQFTWLYPLVLAPVVGALPTPEAFRVAHGLNALLIASTAIPVFRLAVAAGATRIAGYAAAATAVVLPWVVHAGFLMTESVAYPAFAWAVLAMHAAIVAPSRRNIALACVALFVAAGARTQFVLLAAAFPAVGLVHAARWELRQGGGPLLSRLASALTRPVARHPALTAVAGAATLAAVIVALSGRAPELIGTYGAALEGDLVPSGLGESMRLHGAALLIGLGVAPMVGGVAFSAAELVRPSSPQAHALALLLAILTIVFVASAASVNIREIAGQVQERYAFYLAAPFLAACAVALSAARPPGLVALAVGAAVGAWLALSFVEMSAVNYSYVKPFHAVIEGRARQIAGLGPEPVLVSAAIASAILLAAARRPRWRTALTVAFFLPVALYCAVSTAYNFEKLTAPARAEANVLGLSGKPRLDRGQDWVDDAIGAGETVAMLATPVGDVAASRRTWWDVEFWNKSVNRMIAVEPAWRDTGFPTMERTIDPETGLLEPRTEVGYAVVATGDKRFRPAGRPVAARGGLELMQVDTPMRAEWLVSGTDPDGWSLPEAPPTVRVFAPRGGRRRALRVRLDLLAPPMGNGPRAARLTGGARRAAAEVPSDGGGSVATTACFEGGAPVDLALHVAGTSPLPGGQLVGLAIVGVHVDPADGGCSA
jgi:hypothetical protein